MGQTSFSRAIIRPPISSENPLARYAYLSTKPDRKRVKRKVRFSRTSSAGQRPSHGLITARSNIARRREMCKAALAEGKTPNDRFTKCPEYILHTAEIHVVKSIKRLLAYTTFRFLAPLDRHATPHRRRTGCPAVQLDQLRCV